jgi:hypothetical protein
MRFDIGHFFETNPHIKSADDTLMLLDKTKKLNFLKYDPLIEVILKDNDVFNMRIDKNEYRSDRV